MSFSTSSDVVLAHKHSSTHRDQVFASQACGCFYCLRIFSPEKITDWVDWPEDVAVDDELDFGATALCPYCGIDSVIGDTSGFPITQEFLKKMNLHWFASSK
jgi:hypothetical protein